MIDAPEARYITINGQRVRVVTEGRSLPRKLDELLRQMAQFGFAYSVDVKLAGTRTQCEVARVHRWVRFREGRWWNPREFTVHTEYVDGSVRVPAGMLTLSVEMCADCGAALVRDTTLEMWAGARPARLVNLQTGAERIAPAVGRRNVILGWYSGKRRAAREYK